MRFIQAYKMYDLIPMAAKSRLPDAGFPVRHLPIAEQAMPRREGSLFPVYCLPKPPANKRWGHRVLVICDCGRHVPFGRMGQHYTFSCSEEAR